MRKLLISLILSQFLTYFLLFPHLILTDWWDIGDLEFWCWPPEQIRVGKLTSNDLQTLGSISRKVVHLV